DQSPPATSRKKFSSSGGKFLKISKGLPFPGIPRTSSRTAAEFNIYAGLSRRGGGLTGRPRFRHSGVFLFRRFQAEDPDWQDMICGGCLKDPALGKLLE
ncbi:MAG: hypothetical protein K6T29_05090, partial [Peptococcaceae bacterium]|nr:hypothetical protein [Peptococcaceae bacterium]